jgi:hypothetical protein
MPQSHMNAPDKNNALKQSIGPKKPWIFRGSNMEICAVIAAAVSISAFDYFENIVSFLICCAAVVVAVTALWGMLLTEEKKQLLAFLFQVVMCAVLLGFAYLTLIAGHRHLASKSRDFMDCIGGFLLVSVAWFCAIGFMKVAAMKTDDSNSHPSDDAYDC